MTGLCIQGIVGDIRLTVCHVNAPWCPDYQTSLNYSHGNIGSTNDVNIVNPTKNVGIGFTCNNISSVILGRSHRFLVLTSTFGVNVPCSRSSVLPVGIESRTSRFRVRCSTFKLPRSPSKKVHENPCPLVFRPHLIQSGL